MYIRFLAFFTLVLFALSASPSQAQEVVESGTDRRNALEVTIYNGNLAQVYDQRRVALPAGLSRLNLDDVSGRILVNTAKLTAPGLRVREMNFDFDLMTPAKLIEKAVGQQVRVYRAHPTQIDDVVETATVLSANSGVVLQFEDRIEIMQAGSLPGRIVFDSVPENLRPRPTLSSTVGMGKAYEGPVELTYLSRGLAWNTDYVAHYDEAAGTLDLVAWVTLNNTSGTDFMDTSLKLVAGSPNDVYGEELMRLSRPQSAAMEEVMVTGARRESLASYHLYTIPFRVDIRNNQTKQLEMFSRDGVNVTRFFVGSNDTAPYGYVQKAEWGVRLNNDEADGLGLPMPAGRVGVYQLDSSAKPQFVGSSNIRDIAVGQELELYLGEAFDVSYEGRVLSRETRGEDSERIRAEVIFRNGSETPVQMEYSLYVGYESRMMEESLPSVRESAGEFKWVIEIPARGETGLRLDYLNSY